MQSTKHTIVVLFVGLLPLAAADHYGPHQCVSIERSQHGSCVFKTNCTGIDISNFEFAFSCTGANDALTKHSFGTGGFDEVEEYDTEVKCSACHNPASVLPATADAAQMTAQSSSSLAAGSASRQQSKRAPSKEEIFQKVNYGPDKCVSTYLSDRGTCIVKTDCEGKVLDGFSMGLVCADNQGNVVRHMFNDNSFEHKETFDTLIPCTQCLSLDNFDSGRDTEEQVLKDEVDSLKKDVAEAKAAFTADVDDLKKRVKALEDTGAKKADETKPAETKEVEPPKAFLRASAHKRRHSASHGHRHQHHVLAHQYVGLKKRGLARMRAEAERIGEEDEEESSDGQEDADSVERADEDQDAENSGDGHAHEEDQEDDRENEDKEEDDEEDVDSESS